MAAAGTGVIHAAKLLGCSRVIVHSLVRSFEETGISIDAQDRGDVMKRRRDKTVNLYSHALTSAFIAGNCSCSTPNCFIHVPHD